MYLRGKDFDQSKVIAPLAFGYLAAWLKTYLGFDDIVLTVDDPEGLLKQNPQIIGISSFTETFEDVIRHSRWFKRVAPEIPIIVGGEHISALPESLPPTVDIGILGEGEETLAEVIALYQRKEANAEQLARIPGLIFWHEGRQVMTPTRPWISDLDRIPPPDRMLLHRTNPRWQQAIFTARGCPYQCTFCASTRFWQKTRYHSVERVIAEIKYIIENFPQQPLIAINDDLFPLNKKRLRQMVEAIRTEGIDRKVGFVLNARASVFDEEIAQLIQAMNGQVVGFGFESASDHVLNSIKGKTSARENLKALELCEKYGLAVVGNFMTGGPDESLEDMAKTWWFIQKNRHRIWHPSVGLATPFPGTVFWKKAQDMGLIEPNFNRWNVLDLGFSPGESVYMNPHLSLQEFTPIYEQFRQFQARSDISRRDFSHIQVKKQYLEKIQQRIADFCYPSAHILLISKEYIALETYLPETVIQRAEIQSGQLNVPRYNDHPFDYIIMLHALEKLRSPEQTVQALKNLLSSRGEMICLCYNVCHLSLLIDLLKGHWEPELFAIYHHDALRFFSRDRLTQLFQSQGLQISYLEMLKFDNEKLEKAIPQLQDIFRPFLELSLPYSDWGCFSLLLKASLSPTLIPSQIETVQTELVLPAVQAR